MKVACVEEMRTLDKKAEDTFGISGELLMENAGHAVYSVIQNTLGTEGKTFAVFCGSGNNGGDGLVIARKILSMGGIPIVYLLGDAARFRGAARTNYEIVSRLPVSIRSVQDVRILKKDEARWDAIVDAIFGTGLVRPVEALYRTVIEKINANDLPVFSVDIPSGINGDTGQVMGTAVRADATVTFGLPKPGTLLYPGSGFCGELFISHISFPPVLYEDPALNIEINEPLPLPPRNPAGHKGSFGDVLFIAGASGYFGAPYFSAFSFMKAGGGYARLAAPKSITPFLANKGMEIVFIPQEETPSGSISLKNEPALLEQSSRVDMVVMGPGLSLDAETGNLVRRLCMKIRKPVLIDGDGITAVAADPECLSKRKEPAVLTPHPGEMARLTGMSIEKIEQDRIKTLRETCARFNATIVLKGAHSLIGSPDGRVAINTSGNSGMATAGSGDVLTGTIAAMSGLGLPMEDAVRTGVFLHGTAGDLAADATGEDGMTARDILRRLPEAVKMYREDREQTMKQGRGHITLL